MRGISAIIAVVLILLITISLAAGAYLFLSMTMSQTTTAAQQGISQTMTQMTKSFTIEAVSDGKVWVRNTGQVPISNLTIYIDGAPANTSNVVIQPGEVGVIQIYDVVDFSRPREIEIPGGTTTESKVVTGESLRDPSLVGYWKFDEGTGTTAADSSGNGNDGVIQGSTQWASGRYGSALSFPGLNTTGSKVNVSDNNLLDTDYSFTIEAFINASSCWDSGGKSPTIVGKWWTSPTDGDYILWIPGCALKLTVAWHNASNQFESDDIQGGIINRGVWTHVAATFDNGNATLYINGTKIANRIMKVNHTELDEYPNDDVYIGALWTGYYAFNGTIDEVRIYNRALSADEIWNHYVHGPI
jgi:flagellin-like protein